MKMFCPPTDKTCKRCQKDAEWGLLAILAPFVSGSADIFEISTHDHFRQLSGNPLPCRSCCHGCGIRFNQFRRDNATALRTGQTPPILSFGGGAVVMLQNSLPGRADGHRFAVFQIDIQDGGETSGARLATAHSLNSAFGSP